MPFIHPTDLYGEIVWLGLVTDRAQSPRAHPVERVEGRFEGLVGEAHGGLTRPSCARVQAQYARGTPIRNTRQISIVSEEELAVIAETMGIPRLAPEWLGVNIVLRGIPDFTRIPPASRLICDGGAALAVDMENKPCLIPAREIDREHPGQGKLFKEAARVRRGVTAWIEREGDLRLGDQLRLHIDTLHPYPHA